MENAITFVDVPYCSRKCRLGGNSVRLAMVRHDQVFRLKRVSGWSVAAYTARLLWRCGSQPKASMQSRSRKRGGWWSLEFSDERIVGFDVLEDFEHLRDRSIDKDPPDYP
jgi:hypothetical protein